MEMPLSSFVEYLVLLLHQNHLPLPFQKRELWHSLFCGLKKMSEDALAPPFLKDLQFDPDGPYPKSKKLSAILDMLCRTGCVYWTSPGRQQYSLSDNVAMLWLKEFNSLKEEEKTSLYIALGLAREKFNSFGSSSVKK